ncbi:hypothetical protein OF83DRAFT_1086147 [Amylostereum chailletii]|nr:hypothetical protein OF83DRAFT_1086147 [Amylostereum chailletii]
MADETGPNLLPSPPPVAGPSSSPSFHGDFFGANYAEDDFAWGAEDDEMMAHVAKEGPPDSDGDSVDDDKYEYDTPNAPVTPNMPAPALPLLGSEPMDEDPLLGEDPLLEVVPFLDLDAGVPGPVDEDHVAIDEAPVMVHRFGGAAGATLDHPVDEDAEDRFTRYEQALGGDVNPYHPFLTRIDWELGRWAKFLPAYPAFVRHEINVDGEALYGAPEFAAEVIMYPAHTDVMLERLSEALSQFHANKAIFVDLGICEHFNFPKMHSLTHYAPSVKLFGTADNFNTSYTERLHIDFTKDTYWATNWKDEYTQMTLWLQRQEKIHRHSLFITWCLADKPPVPTVTAPLIPHMHLKIVRISNVKLLSFQLAKANYGTSQLEALFKEYIVRELHPTLTPHHQAQISAVYPLPVRFVAAFHKLKFWNPNALGRDNVPQTVDCIHARPAYRDMQGRQVPAHFDTTLIHDHDPEDERTGVHRLRVVQVRLIFTLSQKAMRAAFPHAVKLPSHFAYVELFSRFLSHPDPKHRMYSITCSFRGLARRAALIPVDRIQRSVHLFPKFGPSKPPNWNSANVLELCNNFNVNPFTDRDTYINEHIGAGVGYVGSEEGTWTCMLDHPGKVRRRGGKITLAWEETGTLVQGLAHSGQGSCGVSENVSAREMRASRWEDMGMLAREETRREECVSAGGRVPELGLFALEQVGEASVAGVGGCWHVGVEGRAPELGAFALERVGEVSHVGVEGWAREWAGEALVHGQTTRVFVWGAGHIGAKMGVPAWERITRHRGGETGEKGEGAEGVGACGPLEKGDLESCRECRLFLPRPMRYPLPFFWAPRSNSQSSSSIPKKNSDKVIRVRVVRDSDWVLSALPAKQVALEAGSPTPTPTRAPKDADTIDTNNENLRLKKSCECNTISDTALPARSKTSSGTPHGGKDKRGVERSLADFKPVDTNPAIATVLFGDCHSQDAIVKASRERHTAAP